MSYSGIALARHSTKFLYGEKDVLLYREGHIAERVVLYTCHDGAAFARKTVTYSDPIVPDFLLEDVSNGMRQGVRTTGNTRTVFYRDRVEAEKSTTLQRAPGLVADAGFDEFIRSNWSSLLAEKALPLNFLIPSRLENISFQVQRVRGEVVNGISTEVFRLRLAGIWGLIFNGIDVYYSADQHALVRYDGISDLRDASLNNLRIVMNFPSNDRKSGNQRDMEAARAAPLAPCQWERENAGG